MTDYILKLLFAIIFLFGIQLSSISKEKIKFGKVDDEDIFMPTYEADTTAHSVILYDGGVTEFDLAGAVGPVFSFERIQRIKILTKEGLDYANHSISVYSSGGVREKLSMVKGYTYNIENGSVVKTKLDKSSIHREQTSKYYETTKITFPDVKPGSVVELRYTITSNLFGKLRGWDFQYSIPVRYSEFTLEIPEYFRYKTHLKGYETLSVSDRDQVSYDGLTINRYYWNAEDMPAFKEEPFMIDAKGFVSGLDFELESIYIPGSVSEDYSSTWTIIKDELLSEDGYGHELKGGNYLKSVVEEINASCNTEEEKINTAFEWVKANIKWNEKYSIYNSENLKKIFNEKEGNCSDINLTLTLLLRKLEIDCHPVLLSTRRNGLLNTFVPKRSAFDYMIVVAKIGDKDVLLDATDKICGCGDLPYRCLNAQGLKIAYGQDTWINLGGTVARKKMICSLNLKNLDNINGKMNLLHYDYSAYMHRKDVEDLDEEEMVEEFEDENDLITVIDYKIQGIEELDKPVKIEYEFEITDLVEESGDRIYINPIIVERQKTNPFTLQDRKYPVDFGYCQKEELYFTITCPEGYEIESFPKPIRFSLPNDGGSFTYNFQKNVFGIQLMYKVEIKKPLFAYDEYKALQEFFNQIVKTQSELVILKKRS